MQHEECERFGQAILGHFGPQQRITHSLGDFDGDWENLKTLVEKWWTAYKVWERQDTVVDAYKEQRLTVKGTSEMNLDLAPGIRIP
jgi:hypothetical protein